MRVPLLTVTHTNSAGPYKGISPDCLFQGEQERWITFGLHIFYTALVDCQQNILFGVMYHFPFTTYSVSKAQRTSGMEWEVCMREIIITSIPHVHTEMAFYGE
jgi:hypothetical protein